MNTKRNGSGRHMLLILALAGGCALAGPIACPPVLSPDGVAVDRSCPGLGVSLFATPNVSYRVYANDNFGPTTTEGIGDYNDLVFDVTENQFGTKATVTWVAGVSAVDNTLYYGIFELFSNSAHPAAVQIFTVPSAEILFSMVTPTGTPELYFSGAGSRNPDGDPHFLIVTTSAVPEPTSLGLGFLGLSALIFRLRRRG